MERFDHDTASSADSFPVATGGRPHSGLLEMLTTIDRNICSTQKTSLARTQVQHEHSYLCRLSQSPAGYLCNDFRLEDVLRQRRHHPGGDESG